MTRVLKNTDVENFYYGVNMKIRVYACHLRVTIYDTLILCRFFRDIIYYDELNKIVKGTLGFDLSEDDWLSELFFTNPVGKEERVPKRNEFRKLVDEYYRLRGYDLHAEQAPQFFQVLFSCMFSRNISRSAGSNVLPRSDFMIFSAS